MSLVGFRLVLRGQGEHPCVVTLSDVEPLTADQKVDPYWHIESDRQWAYHNQKLYPQYSRYGWGPAEPGPYLKASDLRLDSGPTRITWEALDANGWRRVASDAFSADLNPNTPLQFPLLDPGTYRLKLYAITESGRVQPRLLEFVVIRNSGGQQSLLPAGKPLTVTSSEGSNIFSDAANATISLQSVEPGQIEWALTTSDSQPIAEGKTERIDLSPYFAEQPVLWLNATLRVDGKVVDQIDRILGRASPSPQMPRGDEAVTPKVDQLAGKLRRAKGDWAEGATPVASSSQKVLQEAETWLDEAVDTGYNIVELSAPWTSTRCPAFISSVISTR